MLSMGFSLLSIDALAHTTDVFDVGAEIFFWSRLAEWAGQGSVTH